MNLLESTASIALHSLILSSCTFFLGFLHNTYQKQLQKQQEVSEVMYALHVMTRSIHQAGFPIQATDFSKTKSLQKSPIKPALEIRQDSGLSLQHLGEFTYRKGVHTVGDSDAMVIRHGSLGHVDCLGHRLTKERLHHSYAFQGFFAQSQGTNKNRTGTLMCQSIDSKGKPQNDGILTGVKRFNIHETRTTQGHSLIRIELVMLSGRTYSRTVLTRHALHS